MSSREMRMNEAQVNQMIDLLRNTAKKLRDLQGETQSIARTIDDGALLGLAGQSFSRALTGPLNGSVERLAQKLEERANYVEKERDELKRAMAESGNLYQ